MCIRDSINTGILIRTTYLRDGMAQYPTGATLLLSLIHISLSSGRTLLRWSVDFPLGFGTTVI